MSDQPWQLESIDIMQSDKTTLRCVPESRVADAFRAGAEAMRKDAVEAVELARWDYGDLHPSAFASFIRNLPTPEIK